MAESGARSPAGGSSSISNTLKILREGSYQPGEEKAYETSAKLRRELSEKGLKGFKRGGKVKKTGVAKLHKGEKVMSAKTAKPRRVAARGR